MLLPKVLYDGIPLVRSKSIYPWNGHLRHDTRFDSLPYTKESFPPRSPDAFERLLITFFKPNVVHRHRSGFQYRLWSRNLKEIFKTKQRGRHHSQPRSKMAHRETTNAVRDLILVERSDRCHGPRGQCGVVGEGGEECFQLEVRAKRVCGPLCGNLPETLLCMPEVVLARRHLVGFLVVCAV